jgi:hypothetical protein
MGWLLNPLWSKIHQAITYTKTYGTVYAFLERPSSGRSGVRYYPVVDFTINGEKHRCYGSRYEHDELRDGDTVAVIYNPVDPDNAYVYNALGYWAPPFVYIIPLGLLLTLISGISSIPPYFEFRLKRGA